MLQTNFRLKRSTGSREDLLYEHDGHLGHVTWTIYINFASSFLRVIHVKFGLIGQMVSEKKTTTTTTTEHVYTI